jgi:peroxiredoxin Q/BCP
MHQGGLRVSRRVLVGVSVDTAESHKAFAAHHQLPFHLVSDPKLELAKRFGVDSRDTEKLGTIISRQTIVIGKDGNVLKIYRTVDPALHAAQIETDLGVAG